MHPPMKLYHEPQVAGLCCVHCINTVLQGPVFSAEDLASVSRIVWRLDFSSAYTGPETSLAHMWVGSTCMPLIMCADHCLIAMLCPYQL